MFTINNLSPRVNNIQWNIIPTDIINSYSWLIYIHLPNSLILENRFAKHVHFPTKLSHFTVFHNWFFMCIPTTVQVLTIIGYRNGLTNFRTSVMMLLFLSRPIGIHCPLSTMDTTYQTSSGAGRLYNIRI